MVHARAGVKHVVVQILECVVAWGAGGFGGLALAPARDSEPVTDLRRFFTLLDDSAGAEHGVTTSGDEEYGLGTGCIRASDEMLRIGNPIRMRNAQCILSDPAVVDERGDRFCVLEARCAQDQPLRLNARNLSDAEGFRPNPTGQCHHTGSLKATRGAGIPSPLLVPRVGPPVRWDIRQTSMESTVYSAAASVIGRTDTNTRPLALVRNSMRPLISANKVWSLARPTLAPGCHLVPRWRAMMFPASTCSPPKIFRPSR